MNAKRRKDVNKCVLTLLVVIIVSVVVGMYMTQSHRLVKVR